jgi:hypothetical protein
MAVFWAGMLSLQWHLAPTDWNKWQRLASVALLASFTTFGRSSLEIRPDVPAAFLFTVMLILGRDPPSKWKSFALGLLLGIASLVSLKIVYCSTGFLIGYLWVHGERIGFRRLRADLGVARFVIGGLIPISSVLMFFFVKNAIGQFWEYYGLFNLRFQQNGSHWVFLIRSFQENLPLWGLGIVGAYLGRRNRMLLFPFVITLATAVVTPSPYDQHYLFLAAPLSYFATLTCTDLYRRASRWDNWKLWVLGGVAAVLLLAPGFREQAKSLNQTNEEQIANIRCVMQETQPTDRVFDFWTGFAFYRPQAYYYWFLPPDVSDSIGRERLKREIPQVWADPSSGALVWDERSFEEVYPDLRQTALTIFRPSNCKSLYIRQNGLPGTAEVRR